MNGLLDLLGSHVMLPFWLLWHPALAGLISALLYMGPSLWYRVKDEGKFYFGPYAAFIAAGICVGILSAIASIQLDGETPKTIYTELWFYPVVLGPIWYVCVKYKQIEADGAEEKKRPVAVRKLKSERVHSNRTFPYLICLLVWLCCLAGDIVLFWDEMPSELWITIPVVAVWLVTLGLDAGKSVPQSMEEWRRFMPKLFQLYIAFTIGVSMLLGAT